MTRSEIAELSYAVGQLRQCVNALRSHYGDAGPIRRLENDLERLAIDADELEQAPPPEVATGGKKRDVIYVPDSKSDEAAWMGAQDEGLGFHSRPRTK